MLRGKATRATKPKVALLVETSGGYGRSVLRGIGRYARLHGPWSFYVLPRGHEQSLPDRSSWKSDGIIARIESRAVAEAIAAAKVPVVGLDFSADDLPAGWPKFPLSEMHPDPRAAARMAADHLLERGFKRFAFVGVRDRIWSRQRRDAFIAYVTKTHGRTCQVFELTELTRTTDFGEEQQQLGAWLKELPKPVGLMSCNDDCGREVLDAALLAGLAVPDEMAVVGVDNDEILCELCDPPLSSVALNAEPGGYAAAELLDGLMSGRIQKPRNILVEAVGVVARRSTEVLAIEDRKVAQALQFIRKHEGEAIRVGDVLHAVPISRRSLEMRFRQALHRTIHEEILRARLRHARRLLRESDITLDELAERTGFGTASHLSAVFSRHMGLPPARYRKRLRGL